MPALSNPRHERFAQELAKGKTQAEAYAEAGYAPSEPNASRLTSNDKVQARVAELLERGAIRVELTIEDIIAELEEARQTALSAPTPQSGAAVTASMGKAKLLGLVVDKTDAEVKATVTRIELVAPDVPDTVLDDHGQG